MPVAGETAHVRRAPSAALSAVWPGVARRSRCGLVVSPASQPSSDTRTCGRRAVVAHKPRAPQQAGVGTKTRSAGRTPPCRAPHRGQGRQRPANPQPDIRRISMDVVVTGRHCELSERFRDHVADKLGRLEKHDHRIMRVQVEVENERNPRQADRAVRIELTAYSKGPVIRAEAAAVDKMGALDLAVDKMAAQMRRANDRRARAHRSRTATGGLPSLTEVETV